MQNCCKFLTVFDSTFFSSVVILDIPINTPFLCIFLIMPNNAENTTFKCRKISFLVPKNPGSAY